MIQIGALWNAFVPVLVFQLLSLLSAWVLSVFSGTPDIDASLTALAAAAVSLPYLLRELRRDSNPGRGNNKSRPQLSLICHLSAPVIGALLSLLFAYIMQKTGIYSLFSNEAQEALLSSDRVLQVLGPGILVPVAEEAAYRGLLYPRLKRLMPAWAAAVLSAACFGIGHGNVIQFLYAFPMGLILCSLTELPGSTLAVPVLAHMGANLVTVFFGG